MAAASGSPVIAKTAGSSGSASLSTGSRSLLLPAVVYSRGTCTPLRCACNNETGRLCQAAYTAGNAQRSPGKRYVMQVRISGQVPFSIQVPGFYAYSLIPCSRLRLQLLAGAIHVRAGASPVNRSRSVMVCKVRKHCFFQLLFHCEPGEAAS